MNTNTTPQRIAALLSESLHYLGEVTSLQPQFITDNNECVLRFKMSTNQKVEYRIEWFNNVNSQNVAAIINHIKSMGENCLLATSHINKNISKLLIANNIEFIDSCGNIHMNNPPLLLIITGEQPKTRHAIPSSNRTFGVAGVKVIFACLCIPGLESQPYRTIAKLSTVSLGAVESVMTGLKQNNYLMLSNKEERTLTKKKELLNRWCIAYNERLRPKQIIGRYSAFDKYWWKQVDIEKYKALWGSEVACAQMTKYLKPGSVTIYCNDSLPRLRARFALRENSTGEIELLKPFWGFDDISSQDNLVPPMLVYADLIASGNDRNKEAAELIYEKYLANRFE